MRSETIICWMVIAVLHMTVAQNANNKPKCGGSITAESGCINFWHPHPDQYPYIVDCDWKITTPTQGGTLRLKINQFQTEYRCWDPFTIFDGTDYTGQTLLASCNNEGSVKGQEVFSTGNSLFVNFHQKDGSNVEYVDGKPHYEGFVLHWTTDDGTMPSGSCCSPPKGPSHGTYPLNKDVVQGETTTLVCDNGYSLNGTDVISCGANHLWSNGGSCLLDCPAIIPPENGNINPTGPQPQGTTATITCDLGYSRRGDESIVCGAGGVWTGAGHCVKDCPAPPVTPNGYYSPNIPAAQEQKATASCAPGYTNFGAQEIVCGAGGVWHGNADCKKDCPAPPATPNGDYSPNVPAAQEEKSTASCAPGYTNFGAQEITCGAHGEWQGSAYCKKDCPAPPVTPNGDYSPNIPAAQEEKATASCAPGYTNFGAQEIVCGADGVWLGNADCKKDCPAPPATPNGDYSPNVPAAQEEKSTASCAPGYTNFGAQEITCGAHGEWQGNADCKKDCPAPPVTPNGDYSPNIPAAQEEKATASCAPGHTNFGAQEIVCGAGGVWLGNADCKKDCPAPPATPNGDYSPNVPAAQEEKSTASCAPGYTNFGAQEITCGAHGEWQGNADCKKDCPAPPVTPNGDYSPNIPAAQEEKATASCAPGHTNFGAQEIVCGAGGVWLGNADCKKDCQLLTVPKKGDIVYSSSIKHGVTVEQGTVATVMCKQHFVLVPTNPSMLTCSAGGQWDGVAGKCKRECVKRVKIIVSEAVGGEAKYKKAVCLWDNKKLIKLVKKLNGQIVQKWIKKEGEGWETTDLAMGAEDDRKNWGKPFQEWAEDMKMNE